MALDSVPPLNSLGLPKAPADTRVVVAMSGGVDSSVVAAVLAEEGYDVVGVTLQLYDHGAALAKKGACCAGRDIHDARRVAEEMGFPHYVLDYESMFREAVIDEFADSYLAGATPVPCIRCNERVKFRDLLETARDLDADCMATGHYIQRKMGAHGAELHCAADAARDQSYFLFSTTPEQLDYLRFPLGHLPSKAETRALAAKYGLPVADKPDSQDICFVPDGNYASVIEKLRPGAAEPGEICHADGRVLGEHRGVIHYTIGQRRGLGIWSRFHLSFNLGYPNQYDRFHKRTGSALMVHGSCVSIGCYAMTDKYINEIYALSVAALKNGQPFFRVHAFPFRLEEEKLAQYKRHKWYDFWTNLKEGYDYFENTLRPPNVTTSNGIYAFGP